jgi:tRNA_anti-like
MKRTCLLLWAAFAVAACGTATPVMKIDDMWAEREKSKSEFHKKYAGKDIVVAGVYKDGKPEFDFKNNSKGYEEINIFGSSIAVVHCLVEEKDAASFKDLAKGQGIAVKGKIVSGENDAYPELRPCTMDIKK